MPRGRNPQPRGLTPVTAVLAAAAVVCLVSGVAPRDLGAFAGYELGVVFLPGLIVYRVLSSQRGGALRQAALGFALGHALEIFAAIGAAALGRRELAVLYAPLVVLSLGRRALRASRSTVERPLDPRESWTIAAVTVLVFVYVGFGYFTQTPLPGTVAGVSYSPDTVFSLSLAAEAKHHWPMQNPQIAGLPLAYENFVFLHMAQISRVTGISLATVLFRLAPLSLIGAAILGFVVLARRLSTRLWTPVLALALYLLVGELDLVPTGDYPFRNSFFYALWISPTYLLGLVFFLPTALLAFERASGEPGSTGDWVLLAAFALACGGAKGAALPAVLGGTVLFAIVLRARRKSLRQSALVIALLAAALGLFVELQYGGRTGGVSLQPLETIKTMEPLALGAAYVHGTALRWLYWAGGTVVGSIACFGAVTIGALLAIRVRPLTMEMLWSLALVAAGLVPFFLLHAQGDSHLAAFGYALSGGAIASAEGLQSIRVPRPRLFTLALPLMAAVTALSVLTWEVVPHQPMIRLYGIWYGGLVILLLGVALIGRRVRSAASAVAVALVLVGALDAPLDWVAPVIGNAVAGRPLYVQNNRDYQRGLTRGLYAGLSWIRDNTPTSSELAVDNHDIYYNGEPAYYYFSAFAERRVFLEGWLYSAQAVDTDYQAVLEGRIDPFPRRSGLNDLVFGHGDPKALCTLARRYSVDYLVYDRAHVHSAAPPPSLTANVFRGPDVAVYAIRAARCSPPTVHSASSQDTKSSRS